MADEPWRRCFDHEMRPLVLRGAVTTLDGTIISQHERHTTACVYCGNTREGIALLNMNVTYNVRRAWHWFLRAYVHHKPKD